MSLVRVEVFDRTSLRSRFASFWVMFFRRETCGCFKSSLSSRLMKAASTTFPSTSLFLSLRFTNSYHPLRYCEFFFSTRCARLESLFQKFSWADLPGPPRRSPKEGSVHLFWDRRRKVSASLLRELFGQNQTADSVRCLSGALFFLCQERVFLLFFFPLVKGGCLGQWLSAADSLWVD